MELTASKKGAKSRLVERGRDEAELSGTRPEERLTQLFVISVIAYIILLAIVTLSKSGVLKGLSFVFAIGIVLTFAVNWLFVPKPRNAVVSFALPLGLYYVGLAGSVIVTQGLGDAGVFAKVALAPLFVVFGALAQAHRPDDGWPRERLVAAMAVLVVLPLVVWAIQLAIGGTQFGSGYEVGIFANRNNAGVYAVVVLALYTVLSGKPVENVLVYLLIGFMFGTLGVLVAVTFSLLVNVGRDWHLLALSLFGALVTLLYLTVPEFGKLTRLQPVIQTIGLMVRGEIDPVTVTFAELVQRLDTKDLSFMFRIKHWLELMEVFQAGTPYQWMFGFGLGDSVRVTKLHLIPHNDYLRFLYELGFVTMAGFVLVLATIVKSIGRGWTLVPLLAVMVYFFSENLVDNFTAMLIFYFSCGALVQRAAARAEEQRRAAIDAH
jgi:hypothetical protein